MVNDIFICTYVLLKQPVYLCLLRIRTKIVDPYNKIVARITQLARLQVSLYTVLRHDCVTITFLWLCVNPLVSHFKLQKKPTVLCLSILPKFIIIHLMESIPEAHREIDTV